MKELVQKSIMCSTMIQMITFLSRLWKGSILYKIFLVFEQWLDESYIIRKYYTNPRSKDIYSSSIWVNGLNKALLPINKMVQFIHKWYIESITCRILKKLDKEEQKSLTIKTVLFFKESSVILCILMLFPFIDFFLREYSQSTLQSIWDEALFLLGILYFVWKAVCRGQFKYRTSSLDLPIILFIGFSILSVLINSPDLGIAIEGLRVQIQYIFWFFLALNLVDKKEHIKIILKLVLWITFLVALYGIYQYIIGVEIPTTWIVSDVESYIRTRVFSIVKSPNILGSVLILVTPIAVAFFFDEKNILKKLMYLVMALGMVACLGFTFSRGAWLSFIVVVVIYGLLKSKKLLILMGILALLSPLLMPSIANRMLYMFTSDYAARSATGGRIVRWVTGIEKGLEHPLIGQGLGRFGGAVAANHSIEGTFYTDNYYVKVLAENGAVGLVLFVIMILAVVKESFGVVRASRKDPYFEHITVGIFAGLVGVVAHNLVENIFEHTMMVSYFWALLGVLFAVKYYTKTAEEQKGVIQYDI